MKEILKLKNEKIAHRGIHDNIIIPENSLMAFKKAKELNYPIELDVQLTKDKKLVVFHDKNLSRLTNGKYNQIIEEVYYKDIKNIKLLNTNETIPTLKEVLNIINGEVLLDIEIKSTNQIEDVCKELLNELKNYSKNYIVKSFNPIIVRWFYKNKKDITRGLLIDNKYQNKLYQWICKTLIVIMYCKPNFLAVSKEILNTKKIQSYRKKYPILLWTILNKKEYEQYKTNADSFICNNLPY